MYVYICYIILNYYLSNFSHSKISHTNNYNTVILRYSSGASQLRVFLNTWNTQLRLAEYPRYGLQTFKTTFWLGCRPKHDFMWDFLWILMMSSDLPPKMEQRKYLQPPCSSNMSPAPLWFAQTYKDRRLKHGISKWGFPKIGVPQIHVSNTVFLMRMKARKLQSAKGAGGTNKLTKLLHEQRWWRIIFQVVKG